jgi:flagellar protein FlaI
MDIPPMMLPLMNCLIQIRRVALNDHVVRRVESVTEIVGINQKTQEPILETRFKWNAETDAFTYNKPKNKKSVFNLISQINQIPIENLHLELDRRETILKWMVDVGVKDYDEVANIIRNYYYAPEEVYSVARLGYQ